MNCVLSTPFLYASKPVSVLDTYCVAITMDILRLVALALLGSITVHVTGNGKV